jgi:hypothetical protein
VNGVPVVICNINPTNCPNAFNIDAEAPNAAFGWNPVTASRQIVPQRPLRAQGGFAQLSFPLSRIFDANPAGRNAGWTLAFTYGADQVKARDIRAMTAIGAVNGTGDTGGLLANGWVANANDTRDRSDMAVATLVWKFNQYAAFNYETSVYLTRSTCVGGNGTTTGRVDNGIECACAGTLFRRIPRVTGTTGATSSVPCSLSKARPNTSSRQRSLPPGRLR